MLVLVALGIIFGGIFGWKFKQIRDAASRAGPPPPPVVAVSEVHSETWERLLTSVGSLVASQGVYVTTESPGQVESIIFESGQLVEKDAPLVQLDASVDRADLDGLIAEARLAEVEFRRAEELLANRNISRADYDRLAAQLAFARAKVAARRAQLNEKTIRAPFAGRLGIRQVDIGEYLAAGAQIVLLQTPDPIFVDYTLPERHIDALSPGLEVGVTVQGYPRNSFTGKISALNPGVDPGTRAVRIRATLSNPVHLLRPGMFAEVKTWLGRHDRVLTLPRTAIVYAPYGDTVFTLREQDGQTLVKRQRVVTGEARNGRIEIVEGLSEGDRVVAAGQVKLRNDQAVKVDNTVTLDGKVEAP